LRLRLKQQQDRQVKNLDEHLCTPVTYVTGSIAFCKLLVLWGPSLRPRFDPIEICHRRVGHILTGYWFDYDLKLRSGRHKICLWQNFPTMEKLPDAAIVAQVRELVQSPFIRSALLRSSDTFLAFVWREVEFVVSDQSQTDRQIIARLLDVHHETHLNQVLGISASWQIGRSQRTARFY
jgi:hypothetical protein